MINDQYYYRSLVTGYRSPVTDKKMDTVNCRDCGRKIKFGKKSCFYCGASMEGLVPEVKCKQCNAVNPDINKFCLECGGPLLEGQQPLNILATIPPPQRNIDIEEAGIRVIIFADEVIRMEKGYPPQTYQLSWDSIKEINVYRVEETESKTVKKQAGAGAKFVKHALNQATGGFGSLLTGSGTKTEKIQTVKEALVCEIIGENITHLIIGDKFNYGKTLGPEMEYNITNNFTKVVKKLVQHCKAINMNRGTQIMISKGDH